MATAIKEIHLSPYKIYWAEFTPVKGRYVTKHDNKAISGSSLYLFPRSKNVRRWFGSKERALEFINTFNKKLDKQYMVRLFTDKQFGMAKQETGYAIPYTKKQLAECYYIG